MRQTSLLKFTQRHCQQCHHHIPPRRSSRNTSKRMSVSMMADNDVLHQYRSIHELNIELDKLAESCGSSQVDVVSNAADCEALYKQASASAELQPDIVSFNTVLKAWSKTAGAMLEKKNQQVDIGTAALQVSVPVYTARDAAQRATQLLMEMEDKIHKPTDEEEEQAEEKEEDLILPDRTSYNAVIDAWAKSRATDASVEAEKLLNKLKAHDCLQPDSLSYNAVLQTLTFSKDPQATTRMQILYDEMEHLHTTKDDNLVKPTIRSANIMINAHAKRVNDYMTKMNHIVEDNNHRRELAMEQAVAAHDLLKRMSAKYKETQDYEYQPDVMTYTSVMDAYGRCAQLHATLEAEALLQELEDLYETTRNSKLQPNFRTYTSMLVAWSKTTNQMSNAPQRAEKLLEKMEQLHKQSLSTKEEAPTRPNSRSYTAVIQCWGRSRDNTKAQRALRILKKMKDSYKEGNVDAKPNIFSYNAAIDACARCQGDSSQQTEALKIAFAMLRSLEMDNGMVPNHVTYSTLLKAAAFLLPAGAERNSIAKAVFTKAQKGGMVDRNTLKCLRMAMDNEDIHGLLKQLEDLKGNFDYEKMPPAWSRNVASFY